MSTEMNFSELATVVITPRERFSIARQAFESLIENSPAGHAGVYVVGGADVETQCHFEAACARAGYQLIVRDEFLGTNAARNLGLAQARSKYVVFMDNDVVVEPGWLDALVQCAEEEGADMVTPLVLIGDPAERNMHSLGGDLIIENNGDKLLLTEDHYVRQVNVDEMAKPMVRHACDFAEFHCVLMRRSVFDKIGPMDEKVLGAAEHIDLALHLREKGCRGFAEPTSVVAYLSSDYLVGDLATFSLRWSEHWHESSLKHIQQKWNLSPAAQFLADYRSFWPRMVERCLVGLERRPAPSDQPPAQTIVQLLDQMKQSGYAPEGIVRVRDAYMVASELFAGAYRSSGRTFLAHLVGVASILAATGANPVTVAAAVLHAAHAQAVFPTGVQSVEAMRRWLKRRVGSAVEELAFAYSHLSRHDYMRFVAQGIDAMPIVYANAALIRIANGIEDREAGDYRYSSGWVDESNEQAIETLPAFEAIAGRLGVPELASALRRAVVGASKEESASELRPKRPRAYSFDPKTGAMRDLPERRTVAPARPERRKSRGQTPGHRSIRSRFAALSRLWRDSKVVLAPTAIQAINSGAVAYGENGADIVTDAQPWGYSAQIDLAATLTLKGPATIGVRLQVDRGRIGVMVLERGSTVYQLVNEQDVAASGAPVNLAFNIEAIEEAGVIIFRAWPSPDSATHLRVFAVDVTPTHEWNTPHDRANDYPADRHGHHRRHDCSKEFFDLIVVDECHRGSAAVDSVAPARSIEALAVPGSGHGLQSTHPQSTRTAVIFSRHSMFVGRLRTRLNLNQLGALTKEAALRALPRALKASRPADARSIILLHEAMPLNGGECSVIDGRVHVTTDPRLGAYSALVPLAACRSAFGPALIRCHVNVLEHTISVAALAPDRYTMIAERVTQSVGPQTVELTVPALEQVGALLVRNFSVSGHRSRATVSFDEPRPLLRKALIEIREGRPRHVLKLPLRRYVFSEPPYADVGYLTETREIAVADAAAIVIDAWAVPEELRYTSRYEKNIVEKLGPTLAALRATGMAIIHAPHDRPVHPRAAPIDGETVIPGEIMDSNVIKGALSQSGIRHLFYLGYNSNKCIMLRSIGMLEMARIGFNVTLVRDASIACETDQSVGEAWFHQATVAFIECNFGTTIAAEEIQTAAHEGLLSPSKR